MKTLPPLLQNRLEELESLLAARQLVHAKRCTIDEAAAALDVSPEVLEAVNPNGYSLEEIAEFLEVSHQYLSTLCSRAYEKVRLEHPELREELRAS